jgi:hypothetical protein
MLDQQISKFVTVDQDNLILNVAHVITSGLGETGGRKKNSLTRFSAMQSTDERLNFLAADLVVVPAFGLYVNHV